MSVYHHHHLLLLLLLLIIIIMIISSSSSHIQDDDAAKLRTLAQGFSVVSPHMVNCVGAVDGLLLPIAKPPSALYLHSAKGTTHVKWGHVCNQRQFYCRKQFYALNVQARRRTGRARARGG